MNTSVRPAAVTAGKTALAIVAILSLLLSLFAIVRPTIAFHEGAQNVGPEVMPTNEAFPGGNPVCPAGSVGTRFNDPEPGDTATVTLSDGSVATITLISVVGNTFTFEVENGLAAKVFVKATPTQNVYDYTGASPGFAGPGIAHDDGLISPASDSISHVDFCLIPTPKGDIELVKDLQPSDDAGLFNLFIKTDGGGETIDTESDVTDGGTTGVNTVEIGTYEVSETAGTETSLDDYTSSVSCVDRGTTNVVASGTGPGPVDVVVGADDDIVCTIINVRETGQLELIKDLVPSDDGGLFNLFIKTDGGGETVDSAPNIGDGGTTGANTVNTGTYEVSETAGTETSLDDYTSSVSCVDRGTTNVVANGTGPGPVDVTVEANDDIVCTITNTLEDVPAGGIEVTKVADCDCDTFTPGFYFNRGGNNAGVAFANDSLAAEWVTIDGETFGDGEFNGETGLTPVEEVHAYIDADLSGEDGHNGLSATGQLVRHFLATTLNVRMGLENECDLASLVYDNDGSPLDGMTVGEILAIVDDVLAGTGPAGVSVEDVKDALDDINNSGDGESADVLDCSDEQTGEGLEGATFDLYMSEDETFTPDEKVNTLPLVTDANGKLSLTGLTPGTYFLVETAAPESCEVPAEAVFGPIEVVDGQTATITIENECEGGGEEEQFGSITIIKNAVPDAAIDFAFTTSGAGLASFSLDDDADGALPNQWTFSDLAAGSYSVTESATAGWTLTSINCSEGGIGSTVTRVANIELTGSENVTCTFVNTQDSVTPQGGSITIIKNAVPDAAVDFAFTTTGSGLASFSLDDDADAALPNQRTFSSLAVGSYTVVEGTATGWTLTSISCSAGGSGNTGTRTASITLTGSENVTCTFVNTLQGGGTLPGAPRAGTLGGNPAVPNTAMETGFTGVPSAAILALVMLSGLAAAGYAARAEVRRRR